jgi:hypothetical protein
MHSRNLCFGWCDDDRGEFEVRRHCMVLVVYHVQALEGSYVMIGHHQSELIDWFMGEKRHVILRSYSGRLVGCIKEIT